MSVSYYPAGSEQQRVTRPNRDPRLPHFLLQNTHPLLPPQLLTAKHVKRVYIYLWDTSKEAAHSYNQYAVANFKIPAGVARADLETKCGMVFPTCTAPELTVTRSNHVTRGRCSILPSVGDSWPRLQR